jgi:hypothetical protein
MEIYTGNFFRKFCSGTCVEDGFFTLNKLRRRRRKIRRRKRRRDRCSGKQHIAWQVG